MPLPRLKLLLAAATGLLGFCIALTAQAASPVTLTVTIKDHRFAPSEIHVPTGVPILLKIRNEDPTPEEFESSALQVEKVIAGAATVTVKVRPLGPGRFPFTGEFHADTAQGAVIAE